MGKQSLYEIHEELVQTLPDGYFSGLKDVKKFKLKGQHKTMKAKKHKRNKKKGW